MFSLSRARWLQAMTSRQNGRLAKGTSSEQI
jgi:hypothetical protein